MKRFLFACLLAAGVIASLPSFPLARPGEPFTSPGTGAWSEPGPVRGPFTQELGDGSLVTYSWFIEQIHAAWPIDRDYMPPPSRGELVALDPALLVTPPEGLEVGYVPIVTRQEASK